MREAPMAAQKLRMASAVKPRRRMPEMRWHARIVPSVDAFFLHQLQQLALAQQGVGEVQAVELDLLRGKDSKLLDVPLVERLMVGELQGTHGVRDLFERIRLAVREVVHRIDAPLVAGAVMLGVEDAVHDRVAHVEVGRGHVDLGAQDAGAVGKLALAHALKQVEILLDAAVAVGAVCAGLGEGAAMLANLLGGEVIDVGLAGLDQLHRPREELIEVVGGVAETVPLEAEPAHILLDGVHVLLLFLLGIGVVKAQVGEAAELVGQIEVEADGLGVADVQVSVGLRRKARLNDGVAVLLRLQILDEHLADEVGGTGGGLRRDGCGMLYFPDSKWS